MLCRETGWGHTVHPHACGDDVAYHVQPLGHRGSPPRVWGRLGATRYFYGDSRFTPTRVGTTCTAWSNRTRASVHPHACGDDSHANGTSSSKTGSPPRVWGPLPHGQRRHHARRFTPTRVGTTTGPSGPCSASTVHPHACGDDRRGGHPRDWGGGSPPRVWGRPPRRTWYRAARRFTPTRVGTTPRPSSRRRTRPVHPHACGDDAGYFFSRSSQFGSPPRVWGRRASALNPPGASRFTPTRVGTT